MSRKDFAWLRVYTLTIVALACSLLLFVRYRQRPDTATLTIVPQALTSAAGTDSTLYMQMGADAFHSANHRIYQQLFFDQHEKFIYPPSSLFLTEAFDWLSAHHLSSEAIWKTLLEAGWVGAILAGALLYKSRKHDATWIELVCVIVLGVLFLPFAEAFYRGQVQMVLTFLWGLSVLLWDRRQAASSGFVLAITCAFKPQLAIFLLWGALRREWRFTIAFGGTAAAILVASIVHFGWRNQVDYLVVLSYLSRHGEALWANQSVNGLLNRLLRNGNAMSWNPTVYPPYRASVYIISSLFSLLCLAAGLLVPWLFRWMRTTADFVFLGCMGVLMSPITWEHHYGYFFSLIVLLLVEGQILSRWNWLLVCGCVLAMANRWPFLDHHIQGIKSLVGDYLLFSGVVLSCLLCMSHKRVADTSGPAKSS